MKAALISVSLFVMAFLTALYGYFNSFTIFFILVGLSLLGVWRFLVVGREYSRKENLWEMARFVLIIVCTGIIIFIVQTYIGQTPAYTLKGAVGG